MNDKNICAPSKKDFKISTCFTLNQLIELCKAYNRYISKQKLNPYPSMLENKNPDLIEINNDKKHLLNELRKKFEDVCSGDELCITKQSFMNELVKETKEEIENFVFRPTGPTEPYEWLSTFDINKIMMQYENVFPKFSFLGAVPRDCDSLAFCSLYRLDYDSYLKNNKENLGIIYNLDKHGQPGSHWVALFIDIPKGEIYFCDSGGRPPVNDMLEFINNFRKYYRKKTGKNAIFKYNKKSYQKDNSECGIYSCNFIIRMLNGESFDSIVNNPLIFKEINSCRNVYFRNNPSEHKPNKLCDPMDKVSV